MRKENLVLLFGFILVGIGIMFAIAYGGGNSTSNNMTLDCIRMFYSDSWDKGYVTDLAQYCHGKG